MTLLRELPKAEKKAYTADELTPEMLAWQAETEPSLLLRVWLGADGAMVHFRWPADVNDADTMSKPLDDMLKTVMAAMGELYKIADALVTVRRVKAALDGVPLAD